MSKISQRLDFRQSQDLVMTPQLQQAIKLLQMNNVELAEFVEEELEQNPLLEKGDAREDQDKDSESEKNARTDEKDEIQENFDQAWTGDEDGGLADYDPGSSMAAVADTGGSRSFDSPDYSFEENMSRPETLREHLLSQLNMTCEDPRDRLVGSQLVDMLDESGYLREGTDDLAARLACSPERIETLLSQMKKFDPAGVFAADLIECLSLQLAEQDKLDKPMQALLENLDMLAAHDVAGLAEKCDVNTTYLQDMIADIKALNPKPASDFDHVIAQTVVPDVIMKQLPTELGGGWRVELNHDTLPKVLINQEYYTEVAGQAKDKKDKAYLNEQLQSANWLVKAMDQRAKTIIKVAGEIVEHQNGFFLYGIEYMKPLTLREIAGEIEMHESTVSRVTTNKYIGTPRGVFELKFFFSAALGEGDDAIAAEAVKAMVKNMIDAEDPKKVLSDDKIAQALQEDGIDIARRTVAKYREEMHIPSSVDRRKRKKNLLKT